MRVGVWILQVKWTRPALADLIEAQAYITRENPQAAGVIARRIWDASQTLADNPRIGRMGHVPGTRERVVTRTPYLIVYRIREKRVEILHVYHGKRYWQAQSEGP